MASTNFKVFNEANDSATTYTDAEYAAATQRLSGVTPGMAISRMHNKMYFQWSVMCAAIANYLVSRGYDCNDNSISGIEQALSENAGLNIREGSTAYAAGDISFCPALASNLYLECLTPGTTAATIPAAFETAAADDTITDGSVVWIVRKIVGFNDIGYRQPSTTYAAGAIAYHASLPTGYYLECTTAGTTSSGALSIGGGQ